MRLYIVSWVAGLYVGSAGMHEENLEENLDLKLNVEEQMWILEVQLQVKKAGYRS